MAQAPLQPPMEMAWWRTELSAPRHQVAYTALSTLQTLQSSRVSAGLLYEALYEQRPYTSDSGSFVGGTAGDFGWVAQSDEIALLTYNAMQVGFDTLVSKLMQANPQVRCTTDNGSFETRKKAEILERVIRSEFDKLQLYDVKEETDLDMLIFGFGEMRFDIDEYEKGPKIRRVHPLDVYYDVLEARDAPPLTRYEVTLVTKEALKEEYPEFAMEIDAATIGEQNSVYTMRGLNPDNMVQLCEAIRKPAFPGAAPGKRILFISTAVLHEEDWNRDFPVVRSHWTKRRRGPYPIPAAEQIVFLQRNLNRMVEREHECIYNLATPRILLDESCGVPPSHFQTSGVSDIIQGNFTGRPEPHIMNAKVVPDDIRIAIQQTKQDIAQILGINSLESVGEKPEGLDTQPGIAEYTNQAGLRHFKTLKENERFVLAAAKKLLETLRECRKRFGAYPVLAEAMGEYEKIDFEDADLPPDALRIELQAANMLPLTPAGRLQSVTQLAATGAFTPKQVIRMFQSPDIMAITNDVTAAEQEVEWSIYEMTKPKGRYLPPTEHSDLTLGIERVNAAWERCRRQGFPSAVMERLDRWLADALALQKQQQQAVMQQQMMMQAMNQQNPQGMQAGQALSEQPGQTGAPSPAPGGMNGSGTE
jgi:hypothetical protein